ncbi:MAG: SAM-dependent methyltransferase [bacterium]
MRLNKVEFGDWQTNYEFAKRVCLLLKKRGVNPLTLIEPTCGIGNFIFAALDVFDNIKTVYAIEINSQYVSQLIKSSKKYKDVNFVIIKDDIFTYDLSTINIEGELLILGNPPWVTNSVLSSLNSSNLPKKYNINKVNGIDSITGKSNFDIAESILIKLISNFSHCNGHIALLVKNSVVKNIIEQFNSNNLNLGELSQFEFNATLEFNVSVSASLFCAQFNRKYNRCCNVYDIYSLKKLRQIGYSSTGQIVANLTQYNKYKFIDGVCQLEWRSGIKHDCAKVMELEKNGNAFINGYYNELDIETKSVFPLIKSSDIKSDYIKQCRKYIIVTQSKPNENTNNIKLHSPKLYNYLETYSKQLKGRKSSIYKNKYNFSIFGVGEYSFKPYKIIISSLYKKNRFSLISSIDGQIAMIDDTCYSIGFNNKLLAEITLKLLNSPTVQEFISSISFKDAKRTVTKDLLMRIDLQEVFNTSTYQNLEITKEEYLIYHNWINNVNIVKNAPSHNISKQLCLF